MIVTIYLMTITSKREKGKSWHIAVGLETTTTIIIGGSDLLIRCLFFIQISMSYTIRAVLSQNNLIYILPSMLIMLTMCTWH